MALSAPALDEHNSLFVFSTLIFIWVVCWRKQIRVSVCAVLSLSPLPVGNHRVFRMFIPGHARLIHTLFEPQNEKTVYAVYHQGRYKPPCSVTMAARLEILHIGNIGIVISGQWTEMVLIRLRGFADRFTPFSLLFANSKNRFSREVYQPILRRTLKIVMVWNSFRSGNSKRNRLYKI